MEKQTSKKKIILCIVSYILVAALSSVLTMFLFGGTSKLGQLKKILQLMYIGEMDIDAVEDAAADAMVQAIGDRWSFYMSAEEYTSYKERKSNSYVGVGITVSPREDGKGIDIIQVEPAGSAVEAGILPGDIIVEVEGQEAAPLGVNGIAEIIRGEEGTKVTITVLRNEERLTFTMPRKSIPVIVTEGQMLSGDIGLVTIANFNANCAQQSIEVVDMLLEQGAQKLIFDVRNNPGGYVDELVELLDYLLPKGLLFHSVEFSGLESKDYSDENCVELPMAVLVNGESYSAAEFFAAALDEYDWATVVGEPTCGKGYYQRVQNLLDGSAVNLSVGKYFTPNGISLTEVGGLKPEITVAVDEETAAKIYAGVLQPEDDPQMQAAIAALTEN